MSVSNVRIKNVFIQLRDWNHSASYTFQLESKLTWSTLWKSLIVTSQLQHFAVSAIFFAVKLPSGVKLLFLIHLSLKSPTFHSIQKCGRHLKANPSIQSNP